METALAVRDTTGRFLPGNTLGRGHGNPLARELVKLRQAMLDCCTPERMRAVMDELFALCLDGPPRVKLQAIQYLHDRVYGKPKESLDLSVTGSVRQPMDCYSDEQIRSMLMILDSPAGPRHDETD